MKRTLSAIALAAALAFLGARVLESQQSQRGQPVDIISGSGLTPDLANGLTNSSHTISTSAGAVGAYYCYNPNASVAYVQFYDTSSAVSVGVTTPKWSIGIPATGAANLGLPMGGLNFANAMKVAATTTVTNGTAPATALDCNFGYRN